MKASFMKVTGAFPTLFVWGTQGSGKSSLCIDIMWPLFGVRDAEPYSATETEFALLKLLTSTQLGARSSSTSTSRTTCRSTG